MAVAATRVTGADSVFGNKRVKVRDLALTGSYPAAGEVITPAAVGLEHIDVAIPCGGAAETDLTGGWVAKFDYQTNGDVHLVLFESAGAGLVSTQKPAEAYESAAELRCIFVGH